jgi:hypothetical protein
LSLTRHFQATEEELWNEGRRVSLLRQLTLYGRADVSVDAFLSESLQVVAKPLPENPNHADAIGWPANKAEQKIKALEIARNAAFVSKPA